MISKKDQKALQGISNRQYYFCQVFLIIFAIIYLFSAYHNFSLGLGYGKAIGLNFEAIMHMWNSEIELEKLYTGYEMGMIFRINLAMMSLGVAIIPILVLVAMPVIRNRNKRVLAALENSGVMIIDSIE